MFGLALATVVSRCVPSPPLRSTRTSAAPASARDERLQERGRQLAPLCSRQTAAVRIQDLHAHMVCAGVKVGADTADDRLLVTPGHDSIHQPVAATPTQVLIVEPEPAEVVGVVGQLQVTSRVPPRDLTRLLRIVLEHHGLLWD